MPMAEKPAANIPDHLRAEASFLDSLHTRQQETFQDIQGNRQSHGRTMGRIHAYRHQQQHTRTMTHQFNKNASATSTVAETQQYYTNCDYSPNCHLCPILSWCDLKQNSGRYRTDNPAA